MKKLIPVAALIATMSIPAFAQEATTPANPAAQPAAPMTSGETTAVKSTTTADISANKLINSSVRNAANEAIGDINDVILGSDGRVAAVIVGVGGFLGLGEKNVALPFDQLMFAKDENGKLNVTTSMTKESLQSAPEYVKPDRS